MSPPNATVKGIEFTKVEWIDADQEIIARIVGGECEGYSNPGDKNGSAVGDGCFPEVENMRGVKERVRSLLGKR